MSDPFAKVTPGQRLAGFPAELYNAMVDLGRAHRKRLSSEPGGQAPMKNEGQIIRVKNTTGTTVPRFGVLGLDGPIFAPDDAAPATLNEIAFKGVAPTTEDHGGGRVVVTLEQIETDQIGLAQIDGAVLCKIIGDGEPAAIRMADVMDGNTEHLVPAASGLQVLWIAEQGEESEDPRWAIVRLGGGGDTSALYKIKSIENDYLVCNTWDPNSETAGEDDVYIAKPWLLQHNVDRYAHLSSLETVDAQTVDVIAAGDLSAQWKVVPAYTVGDLIQAAPRHTGITVENDEEEEEIPLMDINHDARAWAEVILGTDEEEE